jgi:hypothetical protein
MLLRREAPRKPAATFDHRKSTGIRGPRKDFGVMPHQISKVLAQAGENQAIGFPNQICNVLPWFW